MGVNILKDKWILDEEFETIRINGMPFLERSFEKTDDSKKVIKIASKSIEMLYLLRECVDTFSCQDSTDKKLKNKLLDLIEQFDF